MRTILLILAIVLSVSSSFAQEEKPEYKKVATSFDSLYNKGDYEAIFNMFCADMKRDLPLDQTTIFLKSVKSEAGIIQKREFKKYLRTYAMYKTTFEKGVFALKISLDSESKINGLLVNPYGDD